MKTVCISRNANILLKEYLHSKNINVIQINGTNHVYDAICAHPDIYICKLNGFSVIAPELLSDKSVITPEISKDKSVFIPEIINDVKILLSNYKIDYLEGLSNLEYSYPRNIKYNAVHMGNHFIHNLSYTDSLLLSEAKKQGLQLINVKQGYTKCSTVVVDHNSVITQDSGIAKTLTANNIDCLLISTGHVKLQGFEYGFLGGASGKVDDEIIFNGNLEAHPDFEKIIDFIERKNLKVKYFKEYMLEDIGSIIEL